MTLDLGEMLSQQSPRSFYKMKLSESQVVKECRQILVLLIYHGLLEYKIISVPYANNPQARIQAHQMASMPDCQIYLHGGVTLNIEYKSSVGKQRPGQIEWEKRLKAKGHFYYVINHVDELKRALLNHGLDCSKHTWQNVPLSVDDPFK
jgi:hypothetical protein